MQNRFPEKLLKLRKHFHYSQQDVANLCQVDLMEYMSWENGRKLPPIHQLQKLGEIFHLSLDEMLINSAEIPLYEHTLDEIDIPFIENKSLAQTQVFSILKEAIEPLNIKEVSSDLEKTRVIPVQRIESEEIDAEKTDKPEQKLNKKVIIGIAAGVFVLIGLVLALLPGKQPEVIPPLELSFENVHRLSASWNAILVVNEDGRVEAYGDNEYNVAGWEDIVKVSVGENHAVGLRKDGTAVAAGLDRYGQSSVSLWTDLVDISAGDNHTVALLKDGTVLCTGDNSSGQCEVSQWQEVVDLDAGKKCTIALFRDGTVKIAGIAQNREIIESWTDISTVSAGDNLVAATKVDGSVVVNDENMDVENWANMIAVECSGSNIVGLTASGSVFAAGDNRYQQTRVEEWNDAIAIAAGEGFIAALTRESQLIGVGNNSRHIFPEKEMELKKLDMVQNVAVSIGETVHFWWDKVSGAAYYDVVIDGLGSYKVTDPALTLPASRFNDGTDYTVSIVAYSGRSDINDSDVYLTMFSFLLPTAEPTPTPTPIPTLIPTPTPEPTFAPTPTAIPTAVPTVEPTEEPVETSTPASTADPTVEPEISSTPVIEESDGGDGDE